MRNEEHSGGNRHHKKFYFSRVKQCIFCKDRVKSIDYKNHKILENYILETGKIIPARVTGTCVTHQKQLTKAIKHARHMGFIRFVEGTRS